MTLRRGSETRWLLAAGFAVCMAVNLPGHLSYDSVMQLNEGRRGFYANWHPPMMSWLLGVFDWILPGTALFTVFDIALLFGSLGALLWLKSTRGRTATVVLALIILTPQVLLYQGIVWKDVLFANLAIAGFVSLAVTSKLWERRMIRLAFGALGLLLLSVATLVRQNGGVVLPAGVVALAWIAWKQSRALRKSVLYGAGSALAATIAVVGIHSALALRIPGDPNPAVGFRLLEFYDLIGAIKTDPRLSLPYLDDDDTDLENLMRTDGVRLYTPERNDTLAQSSRLQAAYFDSPEETIPEEWHNLVVTHTKLYLAIRAEVFRWVFFTPDISACRPVFTGIDGPAAEMAKLGLKKRFDARDWLLGAYADLFAGTPILSHAFFALGALLMLWVLLARQTPADIAIASMLVSALAFAASFFVVSIACDYRYLYFLDLAALVAAFYLSLDWPSAWEAATRRNAVEEIEPDDAACVPS